MEEIKFIIYYTALILFIAYVSGLAGVGILMENDIIPANFILDYNPFTAFSLFGSLLLTNSAPAFSVIFTIMFVPYLFAMVYIIWKALPFT